jgi:hypothetical protein
LAHANANSPLLGGSSSLSGSKQDGHSPRWLKHKASPGAPSRSGGNAFSRKVTRASETAPAGRIMCLMRCRSTSWRRFAAYVVSWELVHTALPGSWVCTPPLSTASCEGLVSPSWPAWTALEALQEQERQRIQHLREGIAAARGEV